MFIKRRLFLFPNVSDVSEELKTRYVLRELIAFSNRTGTGVVDLQLDRDS